VREVNGPLPPQVYTVAARPASVGSIEAIKALTFRGPTFDSNRRERAHMPIVASTLAWERAS
jgi:hypothetical protein